MKPETHYPSLNTVYRALFALVIVVAAAFVAPSSALAAESFAHSIDPSGNYSYYYDIESARTAGYSGITIYMDCDWNLSEDFVVADSKTLTIDMNGHAIRSTSSSYAVRLNEHANLTLTSSNKADFSYTGYDSYNREWADYTINTGGLITNTNRYSDGGGIRMDADSTLTLDGVAVAGIPYSAINTKENVTVNMTRNASIERSHADAFGGGIDFAANCKLNMNNSQIVDNRSGALGGGIYATSGVEINLENNSEISGNSALAGGGIYLKYGGFTVQSKDNTGQISHNGATNSSIQTFVYDEADGGGIHVDGAMFKDNGGTISGLTFDSNYSWRDGGAIELNQHYTTVKDCKFVNNHAALEGGALYVNNDSNIIQDCTITDNYSSMNGGDHHGGGVFVAYKYDVYLQGTVVICNNTNGKNGSADDVYLSSNVGNTIYAYISGDVSQYSKVGVLTNTTGERRIGAGITNNKANSFFIDLGSEYHVSYGTDKNGDMWQRNGASTYALKVNGVSLGSYKAGTKVTVNGQSSAARKVFKKWSADRSYGLIPWESYFSEDTEKQITTTITMPANDVSLVADFFDRESLSDFTVLVDKPIAGQALPSEGTLTWKDASAGTKSTKVSLHWLDEDGHAVTNAGYSAKYQFYVVAEEDTDIDLAYPKGITKNTVSIKFNGGSSGVETQDAHVDSESCLNVTSGWIQTDKPRIESVEEANITVTGGIGRYEFVNALPATAKVTLQGGTTTTLKTDKSVIDGIDALIDGDCVKVPSGDQETYQVKIRLASNEGVEDASQSWLTIDVTVLKPDAVATPVLSPAGGTYNKYDGEVKINENNLLTITASCATKDAKIWYKVNSKSPAVCDATGIKLECTKNAKSTYTVEAWAVKDSISSEHVTAEYVLDDTLQKEITVTCSDTAMYAASDTPWSSSFTVKGDLGTDVQITAPAQTNRVFDHWAWDGAPAGTDLNQETLTISNFSLDYTNKITAVYVPVITTLDLYVDAPAAHTILAQGATSVKAIAGDSTTEVDITSYFSSPRGAADITWAPAGDDEGKAGHTTCYTASLKLKAGGAALEVAYAISDDLTLLVNGQSVGSSAYVSKDDDGTEYLNVVFPETGKYVYQSLAQPEDANISFAGAIEASQKQSSSTAWNLPKEVALTFACGETGVADVEWDKVTGFDATKLEVQTLTVKGTIKYADNVDTTGAPTTVEVKINVAEPEQAEAPQASLKSGTYAGTQVVKLSCAQSGGVIHYTTDGSEPTEKSAVFDGDPIEVAHNTTLKAKVFCDGMKPSKIATFTYTITHKVTFDSAGGSAVTTQEVEDGKAATEPDAPTLTGFDFDGWYLADGTKYDFTKAVTEDVALTARWSREGGPVSAHVVTFDSTGGTAVKEQIVGDGQYVKEPEAPTLEGFNFEGWYREGADEPYNFASQVWTNFTLYARWSKRGEPQVAHLVTFDSAGGSAVASQTVSDNECAIEPEAPTYEGYDFAGWYLADGTTKYDFTTPVTADLTLYAKWTKKADPEPEPEPAATYLVIFDSEGGSSVPAQTVEEGKTVVKPDDPLRLGYNFDGWYLEGSKTAYNFKTPVTDNLVLHAKWTRQEEPTASYLVTFDSAGGSSVASQTIKEGDKVTKPEDPTRDSYTFTGWLLNNEAYDFAAPVTSDLTLVASWKENDSKKDDEDDKKDDKSTPKKRNVLPGTGDASAMVGIIAAAGAALTAYGTRRRK